jgi:DNA-binding transcriptional MocR family regulator
MIEAVRTRHLAAHVAESLRRDMCRRQPAPGDRPPPERDLAAAFAVSHGRGSFVRTSRSRQEPDGVAAEPMGRPEALEARSVVS